MPGETNLSKLIRQMEPRLNEGIYVFCSLPEGAHIPVSEILATFREAEGCSVILPQAVADRRQIAYSFQAAWITLDIHSSLEAVGLTAVVANTLAQHGINCNVVAAFYHDHIFVENEQREKALAVLSELSKKYPR